jgi:hypothetical protein
MRRERLGRLPMRAASGSHTVFGRQYGENRIRSPFRKFQVQIERLLIIQNRDSHSPSHLADYRTQPVRSRRSSEICCRRPRLWFRDGLGLVTAAMCFGPRQRRQLYGKPPVGGDFFGRSVADDAPFRRLAVRRRVCRKTPKPLM